MKYEKKNKKNKTSESCKPELNSQIQNPLNSWRGFNLEAQHLKNQMLKVEINQFNLKIKYLQKS